MQTIFFHFNAVITDTLYNPDQRGSKKFIGSRTKEDGKENILKTIEKKGQVCQSIKSMSILLLIISVPMGETIRQWIKGNDFDFQGFREIWIQPFHEKSFPLRKIE